MISLISSLPLFGIIHLVLRNNISNKQVKQLALLYSSLPLLIVSYYFLIFNNLSYSLQYIEHFHFFFTNLEINIGLDGFSFCFVFLTCLIFPLCILSSWNSIKIKVKEFMYCILLLQFMLILVFSILNIFIFYIFFEAVLIPMLFIIGIWGSRQRKIHAAYQFFIYTLAGSLFMLLSIILIFIVSGTSNLEYLLYLKFSPSFQKILWLGFLISFAVKVPMIPVHIWLPEAHVEAPTAGSMILAAILLKLGTYGFLRFSLGLFPEASIYFTPIIFILSALGILYGSLTTIRQVDLKKIIAYSSVAHMGYVTLGLFSFSQEGLEGSIFLMIGHGIVSGALFFLIGILYDRYGSRIISYYGGLAQSMPLFASFFLLFTLANISFPGTINFIGEILILIGTFKMSIFISIIACIGTAFGAVYSVWTYNRVSFGINTYFFKFRDITRREFFILTIFAIFCILLGIFPNILLDMFHIKSFFIRL